MADRPPWAPDWLVDGPDLENWLGSAGALLRKAEWFAASHGLPGLLAETDQVRAHLANRRDQLLGFE